MINQKGFAPLILLLLMIALITLGGGGYYFFSKNYSIQPNNAPTDKASDQQTKNEPTPTSVSGKTETKESLFSGKLKKIDTDLGLLFLSEDDKLNSVELQVVYYEAGIYQSGKYKGYTRYIAVRTSTNPSGPGLYIFASKDQKSYIYDKTIADAQGEFLYAEVDKNKISTVDDLPSDHPLSISLDSKFALRRNHLPTTFEKTGQKDKYGNDITQDLLDLSFEKNPLLTSNTNALKFYANQLSATKSPEANYLAGTTQIIVVDSTGLPYTYDLANPQAVNAYQKLYADYKAAVSVWEKAKDSSKDYPISPYLPGIRMSKADIQSTQPLYDKYDVGLPRACAGDSNSWVVKNIADSDLQKIGTSADGDVYILTNKNHALYKAQYDLKMGYDEKSFEEINKYKRPTFESYVSKNPLLFIKDYWQRWVILGEYDVQIMGGCGKPVVYLYPEKPTEITVNFLNPMNFDIAIPSYKDSWKVLANPDGLLKDLQPELTNCAEIDITKFGSEYAASACRSKTYPYLYWAGQVAGNPYPQVEGGWIVEQGRVQNFLAGKLDEVGFTTTEKNDFLSYWVPKLLAKNFPYYKIAFLQTKEMNYLAPMKVTPAPKSVYRIFMDWSALSEKPLISPEPQQLNKVVRDGFTLLEWGGLKK